MKEGMAMEMQIFQNSQFGSVKTLLKDDIILFYASDGAKTLGYTNFRDAIRRHSWEREIRLSY